VKHHLAFLLHITLVLRFDGTVCGVRLDVRRLYYKHENQRLKDMSGRAPHVSHTLLRQ
jgi:hypothetical protein